MNSTNRFANRLVLFFAGIVALVIAAAAALAALQPVWTPEPVKAMFKSLRSFLESWDLSVASARVPGPLVAASACALLLLALMLWFLFTRTHAAPSTLSRDVFALGEVTVTDKTAAQVLTESLAARPDVISVNCRTALMRRAPALRLSLKARRGAQLPPIV